MPKRLQFPSLAAPDEGELRALIDLLKEKDSIARSIKDTDRSPRAVQAVRKTCQP